MKNADPKSPDTKTMLADYMENGLLDNIIDMFKHDNTLYAYAGDMLTDERLRVRIGVTALLETLKIEDPENVGRAIPFLLPILRNENPSFRGDAANILGILGATEALPILEEMAHDENDVVRTIAREAVEDITSQNPSL